MTADLPLDPYGHAIAAQGLAQPMGFAASTASPRHVAIIMDGNGRWAARRGFPRLEGHRQGVEAVRRTVRAAIEQGVPYLTLFSFSSENWSRPEDEVSGLMGLLKRFIRSDLAQLHENGVRIRILGRRDRVEPEIIRLIEEAETLTAHNTALGLNVAFNYGGRDEIVRAARALAEQVQAGALEPSAITESALTQTLDTAGIPDPDLLIRTSGEQRISNFLLWQCAYAELVFLDCLWPDFDGRALHQAINEFRSRERRFGGVVARTSA